ncbi:hypothetical protein F443_02879 [Phytophthora nicotianae P1569]|uniref:HAT C-terminal dimerisation domain-containing protein n=1 Tax=Phytophthora nicotianae P1569 TaxID=1317065 RepID=V9FU04_PHYNI|nr:hypothetical protein F443_02879 [Phytophthora nicotianae P1569]
MQGCFAPLLRVRNALHQFSVSYIDDPEFPEGLKIFGDTDFWENLKSAEEVIRPLSNVSYKLERDENTLAYEEPQLRLLERLCGYGIYFYRRYIAKNDEEDIESLLVDIQEWYRGSFVDQALVRFNGDVGQFWSFAADVKRESKLPKLAAVILSIAVNTATCERNFSELAAIHTAKRNRMNPEKARKFSLVRQAVRNLDRVENEGMESMELKRIVDATER